MNPEINLDVFFDLIIGIDSFLEVGDIASLNEDEIKSLLNKGRFVENFCEKLISTGDQYRFERKLKEYFIVKSKKVKRLLYFRNFSDEMLIKICCSNISQNLLFFTFKEFVNLFGRERFKSLMGITAQTRCLYTNLSHSLDSTEELTHIESIFLAISWNKFISCNKDGRAAIKHLVREMCTDPSSIHLLLAILCLPDVDEEFHSLKKLIFDELYRKLETNIYCKIWGSIFLSTFFLKTIETYTPLLELSLKVLQSFSITLSFDNNTNKWTNSCHAVLDYDNIVKTLKLINNSHCLNARLREFLDFNKIRYEEALWVNIEKDIEE